MKALLYEHAEIARLFAELFTHYGVAGKDREWDVSCKGCPRAAQGRREPA